MNTNVIIFVIYIIVIIIISVIIIINLFIHTPLLRTYLNVRTYLHLHRDLKALGDQNAATINLNRGDRKPSRFNDRLLSTTMGSDVSDDLAVQAGRKLELRSAIRGKIVGIYRKCLFALKDKKLPVLRVGGEDVGGEVKKSRRSRGMVCEMKGDKEDIKWQWRKDFGDNDNDNENGEVDDDDISSHPSCTSPFDHDRDGDYRSFSTSEFTSSQADPRTFLDVTGRFSGRRGVGVGGGGMRGGDRGRGVRGERRGGGEEKLGQGQEEEEGKGEGRGEGKEDGFEYDMTKNSLGFPGPRTCSWLDAELGMLRGLYECEIRMLEDVIRKLRTTLQDSSPKRKSSSRLLSTNKSNKKPISDRKWKQTTDFVVRHVSEKEQPLPSPRTFFNRTL